MYVCAFLNVKINIKLIVPVCLPFHRSNRALQISHPIPPNSSDSSTTNATNPKTSTMNFKSMPQMIEQYPNHRHHSQDHQSMPDPMMVTQSTSYSSSGTHGLSFTPCGGGEVSVIESKTSMSLPYVPSTSSTTSMASSSSGAATSLSAAGHHRYVKNKLAQPKFPRTPFVKKHSAHTTSNNGGNSGGDAYK